MVSIDCKLDVSIEACVNKSILAFAQEIYDKYQVKICNVDLLWLDISSIDKRDFKAMKVCNIRIVQ